MHTLLMLTYTPPYNHPLLPSITYQHPSPQTELYIFIRMQVCDIIRRFSEGIFLNSSSKSDWVSHTPLWVRPLWLKSHVQTPNLVQHKQDSLLFYAGSTVFLSVLLVNCDLTRYSILDITKSAPHLCRLADNKTKGALRTTLDCTLLCCCHWISLYEAK